MKLSSHAQTASEQTQDTPGNVSVSALFLQKDIEEIKKKNERVMTETHVTWYQSISPSSPLKAVRFKCFLFFCCYRCLLTTEKHFENLLNNFAGYNFRFAVATVYQIQTGHLNSCRDFCIYIYT